jgi:hypothetical protein
MTVGCEHKADICLLVSEEVVDGSRFDSCDILPGKREAVRAFHGDQTIGSDKELGRAGQSETLASAYRCGEVRNGCDRLSFGIAPPHGQSEGVVDL